MLKIFILVLTLINFSCGSESPNSSKKFDPGKSATDNMGVGLSDEKKEGTKKETGEKSDSSKLALLSVSPENHPSKTPLKLSIEGRNLPRGITIKLGKYSPKNVVYIDDKLIIANFEGLPKGKYHLTGEFEKETSKLENALTIFDSIYFESIEPKTVYYDSIQEFNLKGKNLDKLNAVVIAGQIAHVAQKDANSALLIRKVSEKPSSKDLVIQGPETRLIERDQFNLAAKLKFYNINPKIVVKDTKQNFSIMGSGFNSNTQVFLDSKLIPVTLISDKLIEFSFKPGKPVNVLKLESGQQSLIIKDPFKVLELKNVKTTDFLVSPKQIPASLNSKVLLISKDLSWVKGIEDSQKRIINFKALSSSSLELKLPKMANNKDYSLSLFLENSSGKKAELKGLIDVFSSPEISQITPNSFQSIGPQKVILSGNNLLSIDKVFLSKKEIQFKGTGASIELSLPSIPYGVYKPNLIKNGYSFPSKKSITIETKGIKILSLSPQKGSSSGGTYVQVYGYGFKKDLSLKLGGIEVKKVYFWDSNRFDFKTPPLKAGFHDLILSSSGSSETFTKAFLVKDESASITNASGQRIYNNVYIKVVDKRSFNPIEGVLVTLSNQSTTNLQGLTNKQGRITLSQKGLRGPLNVTAAKKDYEYFTLFGVDSNQITIAITVNKADPSSGSGDGQKAAVISGKVIGVKHFSLNKKNQKTILVEVSTAFPHVLSGPPQGGTTNLSSNGEPFKIIARPGVQTVYAIFYLVDMNTGELDAQYMGVVRKVNAISGKETKGITIKLDLPLKKSLKVKFKNSPTNVPAAVKTTSNRIEAFLNLGKEGVIPFEKRNSVKDELNLQDLPPIHGNNFIFMAKADTNGNYPYSAIVERFNGTLPQKLEVGPFPEIPRIIGPVSGGFNGQKKFEMEFKQKVLQDYHFVSVEEPQMGPPRIVWQMLVPKNTTQFNIPSFSRKDLNSPSSKGVYWYVMSPTVNTNFKYNKISMALKNPLLWNSWTLSSVNFIKLDCSPGKEICDGKDNDCDGSIDEGCNCVENKIRSCVPSPQKVCSTPKEICSSGNWKSIK